MNHPDLAAFIKKEHQKLVCYVRSLLKETAEMDAEDVVHDVLANMLDKADITVPLENLAAYIYRSLKNRIIDFFRTKKTTLSLNSENDDGNGTLIDLFCAIEPNALQVLQSQEGQQELFEALEELNVMERKVIVAHEIEGIPFKELVKMWSVPQNTLLSHKARAMKKLKDYFLE